LKASPPAPASAISVPKITFMFGLWEGRLGEATE
jgi:hypothetical protein